MQALGFGDSIAYLNARRFGGNFLVVAAFDDYFHLSGKKYVMMEKLCTSNGIQGYCVECYFNRNVALSIIKIISYMTVIIPLIMGIGKLIARSQYDFFILPEAQKSVPPRITFSSPIDNTLQKVQPPVARNVEESALEIQEFQNKALECFCHAQLEETHLRVPSLTQEQKTLLENAKENAAYGHTLEGVKVMAGGQHVVLFLDSAPDVVFKFMDDEKKACEYVEIVKNARKEVMEGNLYLLHVPDAEVIEINGKYAVVQEKANLLFGGFTEQKGVYLSCWKEEKMRDYMKTLFLQLLQFIAKTGFSDVKYDNIPFSKEGKVALIDLDQSSTVVGLTSGSAQKKNGLLNYIPSEYLDAFFEVAKNQLQEKVYLELTEKVAEIKSRVEKRVKKESDYLAFLESNSILTASQQINPLLPPLFENTAEQNFARCIIERVNKELLEAKNFSIRLGRKVYLKINSQSELTKDAARIWIAAGIPLSYQDFSKSILDKVLSGLQQAGYIHRYKINHTYSRLKVYC